MKSFMEDAFDSYCGLSCAQCSFKEPHHCGGCIATKGRPFHGSCEVAQCAAKRGKRFCGECESFPCEVLVRYSNDKVHGDDGARIENCKAIKTAMVKEARKDLQPIGYCGHHCDYCFLGEWCGGCRSEYNCCSYATLFESGSCPNVSCAKERGLDACYACRDLASCTKGYYERENSNEYIAKATALFIHKHGEAPYTAALQHAIASGLNYPRDFDRTGSVESALVLLESFLEIGRG